VFLSESPVFVAGLG